MLAPVETIVENKANPASGPRVNAGNLPLLHATHPILLAPVADNKERKLKTARRASVSAGKIPITVNQPDIKQNDVFISIMNPKPPSTLTKLANYRLTPA